MTNSTPIAGLLRRTLSAALGCMLLTGSTARAQVTLASAMDSALKNDPRVKLAQDDLRHAIAIRQETKDAYLPSASANGGAGYTYGITLTVPTIFTLDAQSLIYSPSQRHYSAASRWELQAAEVALTSAREQVEEDVAVTYQSLDIGTKWSDALAAEYQHANALVNVVQQRLSAGIESHLEWRRARRTAAQIHLQMLQQQDEVENLRARLGQMTGLDAENMNTVAESIAALPSGSALGLTSPAWSGLESVRARDQAEGNRERALADARGVWRPVVTFNAQYARVSPINNVTDYYNLHGRYNIFSFGALVRFPILDAASRARQRRANADAAHAMDELSSVQLRLADDRRNLQHALAELVVRLEVAQLDADIAADQLTQTRELSVRGGDGAAIMNPKDVERAAMEERQRYIDLLDATLQLRRSQIFYVRQSGNLDKWVQSVRGVGNQRSPVKPFSNSTTPSLMRTAP